ncbi:MAG: M6 family metalloprotease domain-containing protein [Bacteroidales bacterium]|nr:M6 family metalloprotease domain-containing protein [Bacteroidales bacterium]
MKKRLSILMLVALLASTVGTLSAAPIFNAPAVRIQPNGDTLHCLLSGDEYYHRLHDANGFTIVQNPRTGFWVYAAKSGERRAESGERWDVVATDYVVGSVDPASVGLKPNVGVDSETWHKLQKRFDVPEQYQHTPTKTSGRNHGTLNNIVIFVRFSDENEISTSLSTINAMFNDSSANATSMYNYFKTVSYNKIHIPTYYYPTPDGNNVISYQDSLPRAYYMPYDATTNPSGYDDDNERRDREFSLLQRAIDYVNANSPVSSAINLDMDNDGFVDNICFIVKGTYTGWSDLLWPHKWAIYDRYAYINGKRVYTFNLQLEGSGEHYFSSSTFCHEMFHTLGAPDLYRYNNQTQVSGVSSWDLMCSNTTPPQTMGAYMKWKYGNWIDSIPEITMPGIYTLHSLGDNNYDNIAYKIRADHPNQWYLLEYRDNTEQFETTLPGKGLLIYRIDDRFNGNAGYDGVSEFDEVYIFRPGGSDDTTNGSPAQAFFSGNTARTAFGPTTDPRPWLTQNIIDTTISITNIGIPGETISFTYNDLRGCMKPTDPVVDSVGSTAAKLRWNGRADHYIVQYENTTTLTYYYDTCYSNTITLSNLDINTSYFFRIKSVCFDESESPYTEFLEFRTASCLDLQNTTIGDASSLDRNIPVNTDARYSYVQTIYTSSEIGTAMSIEKIVFNYASNNTLNLDYCDIYMANTDKNQYTSTTTQDLVHYSQLQLVYSGPINCTNGWNELRLNTPFFYNGHDNLMIAIHDNSGHSANYSSYFKCTSTPNRYSSVIYSSNTSSIDITETSISCQKSRKKLHADIQLIGCINEIETATISVSNDGICGNAWFQVWDDNTLNDTRYTEATLPIGTQLSLFAEAFIECDGYNNCSFIGWNNDGTVWDNPLTITLTNDTSFNAHYNCVTIGIENSDDNNVTIAVSSHQVTVGSTAGQTIEILDITGRNIARRQSSGSDAFTIPAAGVYIIRIDNLLTYKVVIK